MMTISSFTGLDVLPFPVNSRGGKPRIWCNVHENRISVGIPPKCGSTTAKKAGICSSWTPTPLYERQYAVVRHPVARFLSAYRNFVHGQGEFDNSRYPDWFKTQKIDEFFNFVSLNTQFNEHFALQSDLLQDRDPESCILLPVEHLSRIFPFTPRNVTQEGDDRVKLASFSSTLYARICALYRVDLCLYETALEVNPQSLPQVNTSMGDQRTDNDQGVSPNMTINTTSTSPKTTGEGTAYRDTSDDSISDNNQYDDRLQPTTTPSRR